jgi:mono/diheme cytochrome c family protein
MGHGGTDPQIFQTIARGVTGTEMPGNGNMSEGNLDGNRLPADTGSGTPVVERGDAVRGEQLYLAKNKGNCTQCHMIDGRAAGSGPICRALVARSVAALRREIHAERSAPVGYEPITVVMTTAGRSAAGRTRHVLSAAHDGTEAAVVFKRDVKDVVADKRR